MIIINLVKCTPYNGASNAEFSCFHKLVGWLIILSKILLAKLISVLFLFSSDLSKDMTNEVLSLTIFTSRMIDSDFMKEKEKRF